MQIHSCEFESSNFVHWMTVVVGNATAVRERHGRTAIRHGFVRVGGEEGAERQHWLLM